MRISDWSSDVCSSDLSGLAVLIWVFIRLPETLHPEHRLEISLQRWKVAWLTVVSERMSVGYSLALMLLFGSLMGFINSSQQIFFDVFGLPQMFPLIFAALVSMMAVTSLLNARFVEEVGTRRIRSEERRVGQGCVSTCRDRWSQDK